MDKKEFDALVAKVGEEVATKIKALMDEANTKLDSKIAEATKNKATQDEIKALRIEILKEACDAAKTAYDDVLKAQGEAIGELKAQVKSGKGVEAKSLTKSLTDSFEEQREVFDKIVKSGKQDSPFVVKVAITMGEDNTIGSGSTAVTLTQNTGIVSPIRRRIEKYLDKVSRGSIGTARALWIEETDAQGTPIFIGEGDGKIQLSSKWIEQTASVKKIAIYGKVTTELMADLPQLISYIKNSLMKRLTLATEDGLFNGDNIGDNLNGAFELATAFDAGALAAAVTDANEFDVLTAIALQVEVANGVPNGVFIHPSTWAKMKTLKDEQGRPIWKDYVENGKVIFEGMEIVTTTAVTAGDFIGGDLSVLNVLFREEMTIQIGLDGSDFTTNKKTILMESRLVQFASANDVPCLVTGDFTTAKAALEEVPVAP